MGERAVATVYEFGDFVLDARRRLLSSRLGQAIPVSAAAADTLAHLVEHAGELIDKESLLQTVWPGVNVGANSLSQSISTLRRVFGERRSDHRFIVTVPGRGYRFIAKVAVGIDARDGRHLGLTAADRDQLRRHPTRNPDAFQAYVAGWSALTRPDSDTLEIALHALREAIALDPAFALAHTRLAHCYALFGVFAIRAPDAVFPQAHATVLKALELDPELAEAHAHLSHILGLYFFDEEGCDRALQRALQLNPQSSLVQHYVGLRLCAKGEIDGALAAVRRAQALEPLAAILSANIGMINYYGRRYDEAAAQLQATLAMDDDLDHARSVLGRTYLRLGDNERAMHEFKRRRTLTIGSRADVPIAHALAGRRDQASAGLQRLLSGAHLRYVSPYEIATIYAALDDTPVALDWLEQALKLRDPMLHLIRVDPAVDALRAEPRFTALAARCLP
jgi:DNA-binding winged helix-turn-helix (wHTH) protein